jgi:oligopeptide/dipeptide ABC transporter ATP-binding protein
MPGLLDVRGLQVDFEADTGPVRVLNGMDLTVEAGQSVGVVGESGSGKTVLLRTILGLLQDPWRIGAGVVTFDGQDLRAKTETQMNAIRGAEIALTTPEPRKHLNPLLRIGEQIVNVLRAHKRIDRRAARERAVQLLRAVGIPAPEERVFSYPHEMSGGMCQRVIIAMALAHSPRLLLADEPTAGLDVTISRQILDLMGSLIRDTGSSLLLVSRDLGVVAHYCQTIAVVYAGQVVETAPVGVFFENPAHPYSRRLLRVATAAHGTTPLSGGPTVRERTVGSDQMCSFAPRCPIALPACRQVPVPLLRVGPDRAARCIRADEILSDAINPWP